MSYYYEYTFSDLAEFLSSPEGMAVAGVVLFFLAFQAVQYVFQSLSLYAIARRRGIAHPGLAWVPVAYSWILGSISDQYQYVVQGKIRNYRKILLALAVVSFFLSGAGALLMANWGTVLVALQGEFSFLHHEVGQAAAATVAGLSAAGLVVYQYISLYDLYQSCNPSNSVAFLVLSAVFPFLASFFLFADRKKERGMPPRREGQATEREPQDSQGAPVAEESWDDPDRDRPVES